MVTHLGFANAGTQGDRAASSPAVGAKALLPWVLQPHAAELCPEALRGFCLCLGESS